MNILILFQVGNLDIMYNILEYIQNFINNYNVFIIFSFLDSFKTNIKDIINNLVKFNVKNYHIMFHLNKGMDIGPYLKQLQYIFLNYTPDSFDKIIKIHTKTNKIWRNELLDTIIDSNKYNKWKLPLDKLNVYHINKICNNFNIQNIFYDELYPVNYNIINENDIDISFYCNYYNIQLDNCDSLSHILGYDINKMYLINHLKNNLNIPNSYFIINKQRIADLKFIAGTIFSIDYKNTWNFFIKINLDELYNLLEDGYSINDKSTYVHAMERIISGFIYLY